MYLMQYVQQVYLEEDVVLIIMMQIPNVVMIVVLHQWIVHLVNSVGHH